MGKEIKSYKEGGGDERKFITIHVG